MNLQDIVCQDKAINVLQTAYAGGKLAHAYLFAGNDGIGKRTTAMAMAKMLLCENRQKIHSARPFVDSCGTCHSCQTFEAGGHPDFRLLNKELIQYTRDGKKKTTPTKFPIDVIREFLIEKAANRPVMGEFVIYVIDEFEKVSDEAQNAMLKTLEEPPAHCVIILLCSRPDQMLPTTLSRCQMLRFGDVSEPEITNRLVREGVSENEAAFWARFSQGSLGRALTWSTLELKDGSVYAFKKELVEKICRLELADVVDTAEWMGQISKKIAAEWSGKMKNVSTTDINRRAQKGWIQMTSLIYSDVMKMGLGIEDKLIHADQKGCIGRLSDSIDPEKAARQVEICAGLDKWVDSSVNEKLIFEQLLFNLSNSDIVTASGY